MAQGALTHALLMRESSQCMDAALRADDERVRLLAKRVLEDASAWTRWESEHSALMRAVAAHRREEAQIVELRRTAFQLIHRKAPFEYLRDEKVRGDVRRHVIMQMRPARSYNESLLIEHAEFLRSACSLICTLHVGVHVAEDDVFGDPLANYEELYAEYFSSYCCAAYGAANDDDGPAQAALLPYLKARLEEERRRLLGLPALRPGLRVERKLRERSGDTQKLARPDWFKLR
jgi:hypothetical protein